MEREETLPQDIKSWLAFSKQKVNEVVTLKTLLTRPFDAIAQESLAASVAAAQSRLSSPKIHNPEVQARLKAIKLRSLLLILPTQILPAVMLETPLAEKKEQSESSSLD
mgnify:CR=1 FL=1